MILYKFEWAPNETIFKIGSFGLHYYSLMFVIAFAVGFYMMKKFYQHEKVSEEYLEPLFIFTIVGTLLGARLGEVFFYNWDYYQNNLAEILLPIKITPDGVEFTGYRGLASHGAAIGIITSLYLYQRKYSYRPLLWVLDRLCITVAFAGIFIRIGNFFNSEIVGLYSNSDFGVVFLNRGEVLPRHPVQLYESFGYLVVFLILRHLYWNTNRKDQTGFLFGAFFVLLFGVRFIAEFVKESQGGFETSLGLLSTGQWLSIPLILVGFYLLRRAQLKST
ncbi:MAG: prolipoprotein diacylglyceryl transferase [Flavobacteriaceae bacterium]|jgi:phosphatidylglycerol:prolipoprotein diacylglycerol transferase